MWVPGTAVLLLLGGQIADGVVARNLHRDHGKHTQEAGTTSAPSIYQPEPVAINTLPRVCPQSCGPSSFDMHDIRALSDQWAGGGGWPENPFGMSNMVWAWGQFIDHDIVKTIDNTNAPPLSLPMYGDRQMLVRRYQTQARNDSRAHASNPLGNTLNDGAGGTGVSSGDGAGGACSAPLNAHTGRIDGGPIYGTNTQLEYTVLKEPGGCRLRTTAVGGSGSRWWLPVASVPDELGQLVFVAGDDRVNENAVLTSIHTVWLREHNRLCDAMDTNATFSHYSPDLKYRTAKQVIAAKMQRITLEEWLPAFKISRQQLMAVQPKLDTAEVSVEFSIAYRLGHTMVPDTMGHYITANLFQGQKYFLDQQNRVATIKQDAEARLTNLLATVATTPAATIGPQVSNALRNILFGFDMQEDLVARNIFRSRDLAVPSYGALAACFGVPPDAKVAEETPDAWLGLLREPRAPGRPLGPTQEAIMVEQFHRILFGKHGAWWEWHLEPEVAPFAEDIARTTFADVLRVNAGVDVQANVFSLQ